ncbi:hypothetical protein TIFTF001_008874 [Ficus carica]|uniref:Uncharacterized protein n=1 Tax=Ficus carica TaxID=3494 RepID=A0AA87ZTS1_FICCA|nr:hypothetical protein TIFTF001_008874 [Ficus carica]
MSDLSDSEKDPLSGSADITGSWSSTSSTSSSSTGEAAAPRDRTLDHLSDLGGVAQAQPAPVVNLTADVGDVPERAACQASTSGREGSQGSESTAPTGEPIYARQRPPSRAMRINDQRVYRRADTEMVDLAGDRPVYSVDYFTTAVTPRYFAALWEEFSIPDDVDLVVPGETDLSSRPPPDYITLSTEYFLRRALHRLNVAPAQLNANAYRILVSCFVLWTKHFAAELSFRAFQNLYRMKSAPSSSVFYYFQGDVHYGVSGL